MSTEGAVYKYEIVGGDGKLLPLKSDPYGFAAEVQAEDRVPRRPRRLLQLERWRLHDRPRSEGCPPDADVDL